VFTSPTHRLWVALLAQVTYSICEASLLMPYSRVMFACFCDRVCDSRVSNRHSFSTIMSSLCLFILSRYRSKCSDILRLAFVSCFST
jgi:hypothetical protein